MGLRSHAPCGDLQVCERVSTDFVAHPNLLPLAPSLRLDFRLDTVIKPNGYSELTRSICLVIQLHKLGLPFGGRLL